MKFTYMFIRLNYEYRQTVSIDGYQACPIKYLGNLRHSEGIIIPSECTKELFDELEYYARPSNEFCQPCFSTALTIKEMLMRIVEERGEMNDYYVWEDNIMKCYHPYEGTVSLLYPWCISKNAVKHFRKVAKYGTFVLGVDRLSAGRIFGEKVYKYL